jgi:regulator of chromosome condensation
LPFSAEVKLNGKIIQICAGDSHSAALTSDGKVYYWGTFRDNSGSFGLTPDGNQPSPIPLAHHLNVRKIVSGSLSFAEKFLISFRRSGHVKIEHF